jgi:hypothetical protein
MDAQQPGVDVDLGGLRMVVDSLRAETEQSWRPGAARANLELDHGIRFGLACPGGQIAAAATLFGLVLQQALENTARQLGAAESLARDLETRLTEETARRLDSPQGSAAA